jgi:spermidine synthase
VNEQPADSWSRWCLPLTVGCLGVSAFVTQMTIFRELLIAFSGNELIVGIVLGNWMLLGGIGAALGRFSTRWKSPESVLLLAQIFLAVLPIADVFLLRALRGVVFVRGADVGVTDTFVTCLVVLAPYCAGLGYVLSLATWIAGRWKGAAAVGWVYWLDNLGSVCGGLLFSFVLVFWLTPLGSLGFAAWLNLVSAAVSAVVLRRRWFLAGLAVLAAGLAVLTATVDLDQLSLDLQYAPQRVVYHGHSPYGNLVVTKLAGQFSFIENGGVLFSTRNAAQVEETVHYAMAQRPQARRVLLISGGISGTAREILKYPVAAVDYVEIDPLVLDVGRRFFPESLADPRIHTLATDGRLYVRQTVGRYDVVILDVPEPSTSQINRFYTREFFDEVHRVLLPGGVVSLSVASSYDGYLAPETARLLATAHRTLREVFANVLLIPGGKIFVEASDGPLTTEIAARLQRAGITTRLVNRPYLAATLAPDRLADLRRALSANAPVNSDFSPILYLYHLHGWMSQFKVRFGLLEAGLLAGLAFYLVRIRPAPLAVFAAGFAASALEIVLLVGLQILAGCLYHRIALVVTFFMLGLGIGSFAANRLLPHGDGPDSRDPAGSGLAAIAGRSLLHRKRRGLVWLLVLLAGYALCLPTVLTALGHLDGGLAPLAILALAFVLAMMVGMSFPLAAGAEPQDDLAAVAARLYAADYVGAALGALLVSTLLIPLLGVAAVCHLTAGLVILSALVLVVTWRGVGSGEWGVGSGE